MDEVLAQIDRSLEQGGDEVGCFLPLRRELLKKSDSAGGVGIEQQPTAIKFAVIKDGEFAPREMDFAIFEGAVDVNISVKSHDNSVEILSFELHFLTPAEPFPTLSMAEPAVSSRHGGGGIRHD